MHINNDIEIFFTQLQYFAFNQVAPWLFKVLGDFQDFWFQKSAKRPLHSNYSKTSRIKLINKSLLKLRSKTLHRLQTNLILWSESTAILREVKLSDF